MRVALATLATALAARGARGAAAGAACAPPLPAGYSLEHVQLFVRHGDRTPITPSLERAFWLAKLPSASRLAEIQAGTDRVDSSGPRDRGFSHSASGDGVYGTLTARGIEQMRETGVALRAELIDTPDAPLLGPTLSLAQLAVHSTDFPRTIESTQALLHGLYPPETRPAGARIPINVSESARLIPDPEPRRTLAQAELERAVRHSDAFLAREAAMEPLAARVLDVLEGSGVVASRALLQQPRALLPGQYLPAEGETDDMHIHWGKTAEVCKCLVAHGRLPTAAAAGRAAAADHHHAAHAGLSEADVAAVVQHGAWRWFRVLRHPRIAHFAMAPLAREIVDEAARVRGAARSGVGRTADAAAPRVRIFGCHDSTLIGLIGVLRLSAPAAWPPYGSALRVELFSGGAAPTAWQPSGGGGGGVEQQPPGAHGGAGGRAAHAGAAVAQQPPPADPEPEPPRRWWLRFVLNGEVLVRAPPRAGTPAADRGVGADVDAGAEEALAADAEAAAAGGAAAAELPAGLVPLDELVAAFAYVGTELDDPADDVH